MSDLKHTSLEELQYRCKKENHKWTLTMKDDLYHVNLKKGKEIVMEFKSKWAQEPVEKAITYLEKLS